MTHVRLRAGLHAVRRARRWEPQTYKQAWLWAFVVGAPIFLMVSIIGAALLNWPQPWPFLHVAVWAGVPTLAVGLVLSIEIYRRRRR